MRLLEGILGNGQCPVLQLGNNSFQELGSNHARIRNASVYEIDFNVLALREGANRGADSSKQNDGSATWRNAVSGPTSQR